MHRSDSGEKSVYMSRQVGVSRCANMTAPPHTQGQRCRSGAPAPVLLGTFLLWFISAVQGTKCPLAHNLGFLLNTALNQIIVL